MLIEEAMVALLSANPRLTAQIGTRLYPVTLPEYLQQEQGAAATKSYPAVLFALMAREREQTHNGPNPLVASHFEIDVLSPSYSEAKQIAESLRLALNGKAAALAGYYGRDVRGVYLDEERDDYEWDAVEHLSLFHVAQKFVIQHNEEV